MNKLLIVEVSGKRPTHRPTESFNFGNFDRAIISNDSTGYVSDWPIINIPTGYREWYQQNLAVNPNNPLAFAVPMVRNYAIKYAREQGYQRMLMVDDNITTISATCGARSTSLKNVAPIVGFLDELSDLIDNPILGIGMGNKSFNDDYRSSIIFTDTVMSFFYINLETIKNDFFAQVEEDIGMRYSLNRQGIASPIVSFFNYSKKSGKGKDLTGQRSDYKKLGLNRGYELSRVEPRFRRGYGNKLMPQNTSPLYREQTFKHRLNIKNNCGTIIVKDRPAFDDLFKRINRYTMELNLARLVP